MSSRLTYTLAQLKDELQEKTCNAALEVIAVLERGHGFPRRLPGASVPKWSAPAVDRWFENWDQGQSLNLVIDGADRQIVQLRNRLEKTYG